jgi:aminoglycoside phosphotransferase family enzyme/predicted kinase
MTGPALGLLNWRNGAGAVARTQRLLDLQIMDIRDLPQMTTTPSSQAAVVAFLSNPESYRGKPKTVDRIDTHGAIVFLAGDEVWKIKRDIKLPYMDFSTLEKRRTVCWREVELNRQTAPQLYLGLAPICRDSDGVLNLEARGEPVEWAVRMRRFDQEELLEAIAVRGALSDDLVRALASHIAEFHGQIRKTLDVDFASTMGRIAVELIDAFPLQPKLFEPSGQEEFARRIREEVDVQSTLLRKRSHDGFVRRCHGDLHLRNIVVIDGSPILFDALEFDEGFATTDILYDVAFVIMDLWQKGLRHQANLLLNRYLIGIGLDENISALAAMPLFLAIRAGIRAMVAGERVELQKGESTIASAAEAEAYFDAALDYLKPAPPRVIAIGGLSGTGKSTLAAAIAHLVGTAPGALHLRSDVERKLMHGVAETQSLGAEAYTQVNTQRVYDALMRKSNQALAAQRAVIVDAVFSKQEERLAIEHVAREAHCRFQGFWLSAPSDLLFSRVIGRASDASDADAAVIKQQLVYDTGPVSWALIDARGTPDTVQARAVELLAKSIWQTPQYPQKMPKFLR